MPSGIGATLRAPTALVLTPAARAGTHVRRPHEAAPAAPRPAANGPRVGRRAGPTSPGLARPAAWAARLRARARPAGPASERAPSHSSPCPRSPRRGGPVRVRTRARAQRRSPARPQRSALPAKGAPRGQAMSANACSLRCVSTPMTKSSSSASISSDLQSVGGNALPVGRQGSLAAVL